LMAAVKERRKRRHATPTVIPTIVSNSLPFLAKRSFTEMNSKFFQTISCFRTTLGADGSGQDAGRPILPTPLCGMAANPSDYLSLTMTLPSSRLTVFFAYSSIDTS
jgi:hypothetical protein